MRARNHSRRAVHAAQSEADAIPPFAREVVARGVGALAATCGGRLRLVRLAS